MLNSAHDLPWFTTFAGLSLAIQLVIRHNLEEHEATFVPGELRTFTEREIRIGSLEECECAVAPVGTDMLPPVTASLRCGHRGEWTVTPGREAVLFLNQRAVTAPGPINSGDEVRCGHWIIHFHKLMRPVSHAASADFLATAAMILAAVIIAAEIGIVYWLPRQVRSAQHWELQITRQRTSLLVDELRTTNLIAAARTNADKTPVCTAVELAARKSIGARLDLLALYIRRNQEGMTRGHWREIGDDLHIYRQALAAMDRENLFAALPPLAAEPALRSLLKKNPETRR